MSVLDEARILNNGSLIPKLGINVEAETDLPLALRLGYRLFSLTGTETENLKRASEGNQFLLPQIYLQLNLGASLGGQDIAAYIEGQLKTLGVSCLDLVMLVQSDDEQQNQNNWQELEKLQRQGRVKSIGVTNFYLDQLQPLLSQAKIKPVVDHLNVADPDLVSYLKREKILLEQEWPHNNSREIQKLAQRKKVSPEQLLLKYNLRANKVMLLDAASDLKADSQLDFALTRAEMATIRSALANG